MKSKKKSWSSKRILLITVLAIVIVWAIYSLSTTPVQLKSSDFFIISEPQTCGTSHTTGKPALLMTFNLGNHMNLPFHFVSATTVLVNFTLSNGQVISVNQQVTDNTPSYDTQHSISVQFNLPNLPSGITVTQADFTLTVFVQEVSSSMYMQLSEPIHPCST